MPGPLTRFELAVVVRVQVNAPAVLRHYLAVEAAMEELAGELDVDPELAAMTGFAAAIDAQLCAHNPERRGAVAAEMLRTESAPDAVVEAVQSARRDPVDDLSPLAAALAIAEATAGACLALVDDEGDGGDDPLDELGAGAIATWIAIAARRDPMGEAARAVAAARVIGIAIERAAELTLYGVRRVRISLTL